jgi:3-hydroxybutyryl-CoA dehydrogenase
MPSFSIDDSSVAIIGAGSIGKLLASELAVGGMQVYLIERDSEVLGRAMAALREGLAKESLHEGELELAYRRIVPFCGEVADQHVREALTNVHAVVEAVPEISRLKRNLFEHLDTICPPHVIIASATSSLLVGELTQGLGSAHRFINAHPLQKGIAAIEIMPHALTAPEVTTGISELFKGIGMVPIHVQQENVGFIFNIAWRNIKCTVLDLVQRGVTTPQDFDRLWMMAFKTRQGPFGVMDIVGLDVVLAIEERYAELSRDPADAPPPFLRDMVATNRLGMKTGEGFYHYPNPAFRVPGFLERGAAPIPSILVTPIRDTLIGTWELVSYHARAAGSEALHFPMGENAYGKLIYSSDGNMSVALVRPERAPFVGTDPLAGTTEERARAYSEYFSYVGTFRCGKGLVYHDVEHCSFPNWSGISLMRLTSLTNQGHLVLSTLPVEVMGSVAVQELVWKRKP